MLAPTSGVSGRLAGGARLHIDIRAGHGRQAGLLARLARREEAVDLALLEAVLLLAHLRGSGPPACRGRLTELQGRLA